MNSLEQKKQNASRRANRVRAKINGTKERPRVSVKISSTHVSAQIINDAQGKTLASASSIGQKIDGNLTAKAAQVGETLAKNAKAAKIKQVVLDKGSKKYHGRLKALAEAARKGGLEF